MVRSLRVQRPAPARAATCLRYPLAPVPWPDPALQAASAPPRSGASGYRQIPSRARSGIPSRARSGRCPHPHGAAQALVPSRARSGAAAHPPGPQRRPRGARSGARGYRRPARGSRSGANRYGR